MNLAVRAKKWQQKRIVENGQQPQYEEGSLVLHFSDKTNQAASNPIKLWAMTGFSKPHYY